jgi:hypothetical protein
MLASSAASVSDVVTGGKAGRRGAEDPRQGADTGGVHDQGGRSRELGTFNKGTYLLHLGGVVKAKRHALQMAEGIAGLNEPLEK